MADWVWYEAGRRRGIKVLHFIHRLSRDPEFHDRRAQETFARYGPQLLLISKFVPGLDAVAPPLAGISHINRLRFLAFDAAGAIFYSCAYAALGYVFRQNLDLVAAYIGRTGTVLGSLAFLALSIYALRRLLERHRSVREFQKLQIKPDAPMAPGNPIAENLESTQEHADFGSLGLQTKSKRLTDIAPHDNSKQVHKQINASDETLHKPCLVTDFTSPLI
jgi:hypothetical protein